jgi:hypothetical protein
MTGMSDRDDVHVQEWVKASTTNVEVSLATPHAKQPLVVLLFFILIANVAYFRHGKATGKCWCHVHDMFISMLVSRINDEAPHTNAFFLITSTFLGVITLLRRVGALAFRYSSSFSTTTSYGSLSLGLSLLGFSFWYDNLKVRNHD